MFLPVFLSTAASNATVWSTMSHGNVESQKLLIGTRFGLTIERKRLCVNIKFAPRYEMGLACMIILYEI